MGQRARSTYLTQKVNQQTGRSLNRRTFYLKVRRTLKATPGNLTGWRSNSELEAAPAFVRKEEARQSRREASDLSPEWLEPKAQREKKQRPLYLILHLRPKDC
jgi:hypothetical protein